MGWPLRRRTPQCFELLPASGVQPAAGTTAFLNLANGGATELCRRLAAERGVLLLPGALFGLGDTHVRVGLGRASLGEGLSKVQEMLKSG